MAGAVFGVEVESAFGRRGVIGEITASMSGNLVMRVGHEVDGSTWERSEHVVLTPEEVGRLVATIAWVMAKPSRRVTETEEDPHGV